ncbi:MAG TPA: hypothetical protein PLR86_09080 [Planctomycetota bacterium]|nr:hypothetical protein [Planctomycetota bacterium]
MRGNMWAFFALRSKRVLICSEENMLWGEEENCQKRREFFQFWEKLEKICKK